MCFSRKRFWGMVLLRFLDVVLAALGLCVTSPVLLVLLLLGWIETGSALFRQERVGRYRKLFVLVKFRTMRPDTASVATHLVDGAAVTRLGRFLRRTKLDELPQLWNVLKGDMSLVGPRPCLPNQEELIAERDRRGVFEVRPGITGLAQVKGIDMSDPVRLAAVDEQMIRTLTLAGYFRYLVLTVTGKGGGDRVRQL